MADPVTAYKQTQRELYDGNAAGWDKWAEALADQAERLNLPLIEAGGIEAGMDVLDLASGAGEPALTAARAVGPSGHVTATDLSPEMLAIIERRAAAAGIDHVTCQHADMESLPFPDHRFDRVICRFGMMYSPNPNRALEEMRRVLKPGGRVALMVWGPTSTNSLLWTVFEAANGITQLYAEDELVHPFCYGAEGSLAPLMSEAGLVGAEEREIRFRPKIKQGVPFWTPILEMNFQTAIAKLDTDQRAELEETVARAFDRFLEDGMYQVEMHVRIATATAP